MAVLDWKRARAHWRDANHLEGTPGYHKSDDGMSEGAQSSSRTKFDNPIATAGHC